MNENDTTAWMTVKDACEYLQVSQMTIFRWMKSGKLSYFKMGGSVRFKRENLDMAAEKVTSTKEAEQAKDSCSVCGHTVLAEGKIQSTGRVSFKPAKTKFWTFEDSVVPIEAKMCQACGNIQLFADTEKMSKISVEE